MANLIRGLVVGTVIGIFIGWLLREQEQERRASALEAKVENDPELVALRKERALEKQIEQALDDLEDDTV